MAVKDYEDIVHNPIFFERNRVFRVYTGGRLFHDFFGDEDKDNNYPEEWIASSVRALNKESQDEKEGISKILGSNISFDYMLKHYKEKLIGSRNSLGILVKVLDSAIRLPVQAHPDKSFSKKYFKSEFGKAEMWIVLATRPDARIYYGFKEQISKEEFTRTIEKSLEDKEILTTIINEVTVQKGDIYFIPPNTVHAIGYGCLILEIQEPTDFTIQPEYWCGDYKLNAFEMYLGLEPNEALECFDYTAFGKETVLKGKKTPKITRQTKNRLSEELIGGGDTECFIVNRHTLKETSFVFENTPGVYIITEGCGLLKKEGYEKKVKKGDYFFLPACIKKQCTIETYKKVEIVECLPPDK